MKNLIRDPAQKPLDGKAWTPRFFSNWQKQTGDSFPL